MSGTPGAELTASSVISLIDSGAYPRETVLTIARGFLPLEQDEIIGVLAYLSTSSDEEIAATARVSLLEIPPRVLLMYAANERADPLQLAYLSRATRDNMVLEALIRNRALSDDMVVDLARRAEGPIQEVIVINQARTLRTPAILDALLENPHLSADVRRRALETREEFFEKKARLAEIEQELADQLAPIPLDAVADLIEQADWEPQPEAPTLPPPSEVEVKDDRQRAIWTKLGFLSVSDKVKLAYRGDRMVRMFLVRDRNRLVCSAVMRNPRMTDLEVESIAGMRNVDEEVLRLLSMRRDWMGKYAIMLALCRNPKAPVGVVLPLINRLTLRDLKGLKDDKGVTQVVRETAKRFHLSRTQKSGG